MRSCWQDEKGRSAKHVEALHLRIKEHKEDLLLAKQDSKRMRKAVKASEVGFGICSSYNPASAAVLHLAVRKGRCCL